MELPSSRTQKAQIKKVILENIMSSYCNDKLGKTVKALRDMCDTIDRIIADESISDIVKAGNVLHEIVWGVANATSGITNTLNKIDRDSQMEEK
jgi:hypothetical protein